MTELITTILKVPHPLEALLDLGCIFGFFSLFIIILVGIFPLLWYIIDDGDSSIHNPLAKFITEKLFKFYYLNAWGRLSEEAIASVVCFCILVGLLPLLLYYLVYFYSVTLALFIGAGCIFLARSVRRLQKKVKTHVNNFKIHNNKPEEK